MKKSNHVLSYLPDYLSGSLDLAERSLVERHLKSCKSCSAEYRSASALWTEMGKLPDEIPSKGLRSKFYAELDRQIQYQHQSLRDHRWSDRLTGMLERWWPKQPAFQVAVAVLCLLIGYVIGFRIDGGKGSGGDDVTQLRTEVQNMQKLVMLSLMKTQSASDRIQGVNWSERMTRPDEGVLTALFDALNFDPNVNVRLAALEALAKFYSDSQVRQGLIGSLLRQTSPLVQLTLAGVIADAHDKKAIDTLKELLKNKELNKTVREQIEKRLKELGV